LITDLQATGLEGVEGQDLIIPSGTEFRLKDVGTEAVNSYLGEVLLNRDVFESEYPYSLQVEIFSNATVETSSSVTLYIGGEAVDRKMCRLGNEGHGTVRFEPFELRSGISKGRVVLESRDAIRADDSFYFVIERNDPFVVTHLRRGGDVDPYMEQALSSGKNLPFQVTGTSRVDRLSVSDSPVLVLDDLAQPPAESLLRSYLEEGGGILLGLGKNVNAAAYNEKLSRLLPVALGNRQFARSAELPFFNIDEANWTHPLLKGLRETLQEVQFYGYRSLRILKGGQVLARFSSGAPALVEASVGKGKMIVFASSLDRSWTDFPISNAYLPFWQMAVQYAAGWTWQPAALKVGQVLERPGSGSDSVVAQSWEVLDPKGQRLLSLGNPDATKAQLLIPGHHEIRQGKRTDWVAVNSDRAESDLDRLEPEELMAVINSARERPLSLQEERSRESPLQPVWWVFLSLAILLLLGEVFLANGLIPSSKIRTTTAKVGMKSNA
jgi:uncharacterized membrane protein